MPIKTITRTTFSVEESADSLFSVVAKITAIADEAIANDFLISSVQVSIKDDGKSFLIYVRGSVGATYQAFLDEWRQEEHAINEADNVAESAE